MRQKQKVLVFTYSIIRKIQIGTNRGMEKGWNIIKIVQWKLRNRLKIISNVLSVSGIVRKPKNKIKVTIVYCRHDLQFPTDHYPI